MANVTGTFQYIPDGLNRGNAFHVRAVLSTALANTDTFTVTLPDNVPKDALPVGPPNVFAPPASDVYVRDPDVANVTSHNRATGTTIYTAAGAVAAGSIILQQYIGHG